MEGAICGIPAFAISLAGYEMLDFSVTAAFAARVARAIAQHSLPKDMLLNVNVPAVSQEEITGIAITRQAKRRYRGRIETRIDPRGREYYWLGGELLDEESPEGTDVDAIKRNFVSITPIQLDFTEYKFLEELRGWKI
jgi:5'-nucleotidase